MKASITEYLDYRDYLNDFYKLKRDEDQFFSYRYIAKRVNIDASHIAKIFSKKRHLPERGIDAFIALCLLNKRDAECFILLYKFSRAKTDEESKKHYDALLALKGVPATKLEKNQIEFISKWYYTSILVLLDIINFKGDYQWLADNLSPSITLKEAEKSIKLLLSLDLIEKDDEGVFKPTNRFVTVGESNIRNAAIKNYQKEVINLSSESLLRHKKQDRDVSTVTLSLDRKELPAISEIVRSFRQTLLRYSDETANPNSVYQLNVQLFPVTNEVEQ